MSVDDEGPPRPSTNRDAAFLAAEAEIAETRSRIAQSMTSLEQELSRATDWREWVRRRPLPALALAFSIGFFLGSRR